MGSFRVAPGAYLGALQPCPDLMVSRFMFREAIRTLSCTTTLLFPNNSPLIFYKNRGLPLSYCTTIKYKLVGVSLTWILSLSPAALENWSNGMMP